MRAGPRGKVIGAGFARLQHRHRQVGHTVLRVVGNLAVPVDDRRLGQAIDQIDREGLTGIKDKAGPAVAVDEAPDTRSLAAHINRACGGCQGHSGGLGPHTGGKAKRCGHSRRSGQKAASGKG